MKNFSTDSKIIQQKTLWRTKGQQHQIKRGKILTKYIVEKYFIKVVYREIKYCRHAMHGKQLRLNIYFCTT